MFFILITLLRYYVITALLGHDYVFHSYYVITALLGHEYVFHSYYVITLLRLYSVMIMLFLLRYYGFTGS